MKRELVYLPAIREDYDRFRLIEGPGSTKYRIVDGKELPERWGLLLDEVEVEEDNKLIIEGWVALLNDVELRAEFLNQLSYIRRLAEDWAKKLEVANFQDAAKELKEAIEHIDKAVMAVSRPVEKGE